MEKEHIEKTDISSRVVITPQQMEGLLEFIEENPALAKGKTKPQQLSKKLWTQCAKKLNGYKEGAKKNGKQWAKSWTDMKYRVRRRALEFQAAKSEGKPLPEDILPLSHTEERILSSWTDMKYRVRRRALEFQAAKSEGKPLPEDILPLSHTEERILSVIGKDSIEEVVIKCDSRAWDTDLLPNSDIFQTTECLISPNIESTSTSDKEDYLEEKPPLSKATQRTKTSVRKRRRSPQKEPDPQAGQPYRKPRMNIIEETETDSDSDDDHASEFLEMEKRKIQSAEKLTDAVCDIRDQMKRLIEVFTEIKDAITRNS